MPELDDPDRPIPKALEALYREVVLDHYRHPRHRTPLADPHGEATVHNPVCGDQVRVQVALEGDAVPEVSATTRGCSIAVAAGSVMAELVRGRDLGSVRKLNAAFEQLVSGGPACGGSAPAGATDRRMLAFAAVAPLRSRHRCALLPWEALGDAIRSAREKSAC